MRAFVSANIAQQYITAIELFREAVEILQWGRQKWKDVPSKEKGTMFEPTYIRAVKRIYMTTLIEVFKFRGHDISLHTF